MQGSILGRSGLVVVGALCLLAAAAVPASADVFVVENTDDSGPGSLRDAIEQSNANVAMEANTIDLQVTGTIELLTSLPEINTETTIDGPGSASLTVTRAAGAGAFRIFTMNGSGAGDTIRIEGLTISNGNGGGPGGGGVYVDVGGLNFLENVVITGNTAETGGGIYICCGAGEASLDLTNSTVSSNTATGVNGDGGGITNKGQLNVNSSTIAGNHVTMAVNGGGGGIWTGETGAVSAVVTNSTIVGNSAPNAGGGIRLANGFLGVESSTIARNTSDSDNTSAGHDGGGIYVVPSSAGGQGAVLANTILAENVRGTTSAVPNQCGLAIMASLESDGYNLRSSDDAACAASFGPNDLTSSSTALGPLSSNGGPTQTIPLLPGSPALNAGNPSLPDGTYPACEPTDQRGFPRGGVEGRCDIGAFEGQLLPPATTPPATTTPAPFNLKAAIKKCKKKFPKGSKKRKKCIRRAKRRAQV